MTDKSTLANQLIALLRDRTATVGDLALLLNNKEPRTDLTSGVQDQVIGYAQKAFAILDRLSLEPTTSIQSLILDNDSFIEASPDERKLHTNLNFAVIHAEYSCGRRV